MLLCLSAEAHPNLLQDCIVIVLPLALKLILPGVLLELELCTANSFGVNGFLSVSTAPEDPIELTTLLPFIPLQALVPFKIVPPSKLHF